MIPTWNLRYEAADHNERCAIFLPSTMISPWSGQSSAAKRLSNVVFPAPEEPTRMTNSPGSITKEIFKRAGTDNWPRRYVFDTALTSIRERLFILRLSEAHEKPDRGPKSRRS